MRILRIFWKYFINFLCIWTSYFKRFNRIQIRTLILINNTRYRLTILLCEDTRLYFLGITCDTNSVLDELRGRETRLFWSVTFFSRWPLITLRRDNDRWRYPYYYLRSDVSSECAVRNWIRTDDNNMVDRSPSTTLHKSSRTDLRDFRGAIVDLGVPGGGLLEKSFFRTR